jgi:hypothetical protein
MKTNHQQLNTVLSAIMRTRLFVLWMVICLASNLCFAQTFDAAADFSATNNPNGVWSYGWSSTLTSNLNLYNENKNVIGLDLWDTENSYWNAPNIIHNPTANIIADVGNGIAWQPGQLSLHPGFEGVYSHARWTAPFAGTFDIAATFIGMDMDGTTTDVHVLYNGASLSDNWLNGYGATASYSNTISVGMGDTIDFAVGYGSNYHLLDDTTGLSATISGVPEPATLLLLGLGAVIVRKRHR